MRKIIYCFLFFAIISIPQIVFSQASSEKVKVFLDCNRSWLCDFDYVRTEMKMVEFVRDRFQSDVHVQITTQNSNSGGEQNQMIFLGLQRFAGLTDTITYFNDPTLTDDDKRKQLVRYLKLGLTRYIAKTHVGKDLEITYTKDTTGTQKTETKKDPWNYWVYQFGANGSFNGNQNYRSNSYYSYVNADKETEEWKISIYFSADKNIQVFKDSSGDSKFQTKNYGAGFQLAKSLTPHWSYGFSSNYQNSLYSNIRTGYNVRAKFEYSIFPYKKFNSERIVIQYMAGPAYNKYYDTTVFFKTREWKLQESVNLITSFTKPWGSVNLGVFWQNYFDDFSSNELSFNGAVSWRIIKGLNFGIYGNYSIIHDQIALRKGDATRDQLLVRTRELLSSYDYGFGLGFSYRFGSVSNSIVNPRFKGLNYSINF